MAIPKKSGLSRRVRTIEGDRANRIGADFLRIDSEIALTYSGIASQTSDPKKRGRMAAAARKAYDTILRLREGIELSHAQGDKLDANLRRLKSDLEYLDE